MSGIPCWPSSAALERTPDAASGDDGGSGGLDVLVRYDSAFVASVCGETGAFAVDARGGYMLSNCSKGEMLAVEVRRRSFSSAV